MKELEVRFQEKWSAERERYVPAPRTSKPPTDSHLRNDELNNILNRLVNVGIRGGWAELNDTPLVVPQVRVVPPARRESSPSDSSRDNPLDESSTL